MRTSLIFFSILAQAFAAPILLEERQGAGVGAGCDAIFSDTDTSSGQIVKQGGAWVAKNGVRAKRQGAGVGAGCNAIFSDTDTSTGQVVKQAGAWAANQGVKRQLDKMGAGVGYVVSKAPGTGNAGQQITDETGTVDGNGTNGSAQAGEAVGQAELDMGNAVTETAFGTTSNGGAPSKRQLDKMGAGVGYVVSAAPGGGGKQAGQKITDETGTVDGNATNGSAMAGEAVGDFELNAGNAVTETAFGTTSNGGGSSAPPPAPAKGGPGGPGGKGPGH